MFSISPKVVPVEGIDGAYIKQLSGVERQEFYNARKAISEDDPTTVLDAQVVLVKLALTDESGRRHYDDVNDVKKLPAVALDQITEVALSFNLLTAEAVAAAAKKN